MSTNMILISIIISIVGGSGTFIVNAFLNWWWARPETKKQLSRVTYSLGLIFLSLGVVISRLLLIWFAVQWLLHPTSLLYQSLFAFQIALWTLDQWQQLDSAKYAGKITTVTVDTLSTTSKMLGRHSDNFESVLEILKSNSEVQQQHSQYISRLVEIIEKITDTTIPLASLEDQASKHS